LDVENWGSIRLTFDDGTRGIVWGLGCVLGGMESSLKILLSNAHVLSDLSHRRLVEAYAPDSSVFGSEYLTEKLETGAGWTRPAGRGVGAGSPSHAAGFRSVRRGSPPAAG
jgi:hypothetical protein